MRHLLPLLLAACATAAPSAPPAPSPPATPPCVQPPVGPPDAADYYVAQGFGENAHLGEDWNGRGGGNTDKGDPVFAMADGVVTQADEGGPGWGPVVRVRHRLASLEGPREYESLYAHLGRIDVAVGETVRRGAPLGTIGDAHGLYVAHLHLEVRDIVGLPIGPGYGHDRTGYVDPRAWIAANQQGCP